LSFFGLDQPFGHLSMAGGPRRGVFGRAASCLSGSEFLPVWKKCPDAAGTMIKVFLFKMGLLCAS
jgi:hypothetical protein